jgi:hypothetical protein
MTATPSIDVPAWLVEQLSQANPDPAAADGPDFRGSVDAGRCRRGVRRRLGAAQPGPQQHPQRLSASGVGHPGRHYRPGHPQATGSELLPGVAAGAASSGRVGPGQRGGHFLSARGVHAADGSQAVSGAMAHVDGGSDPAGGVAAAGTEQDHVRRLRDPLGCGSAARAVEPRTVSDVVATKDLGGPDTRPTDSCRQSRRSTTMPDYHPSMIIPGLAIDRGEVSVTGRPELAHNVLRDPAAL